MRHDERMTPWRLRERVRKLPAGDLLVRWGIFVLGAVFIAIGFALIALPGPLTIPPVLLGLAIWALEFEFAQAWLDRAKVPARKAWSEAVLHPWRTGFVSAAGMALALVAAVVAAQYDLFGRARDLLT